MMKVILLTRWSAVYWLVGQWHITKVYNMLFILKNYEVLFGSIKGRIAMPQLCFCSEFFTRKNITILQWKYFCSKKCGCPHLKNLPSCPVLWTSPPFLSAVRISFMDNWTTPFEGAREGKSVVSQQPWSLFNSCACCVPFWCKEIPKGGWARVEGLIFRDFVMDGPKSQPLTYLTAM